MAQKITVELIDDIDGSEAAETVEFSLGTDAYEIELNADNALALRDALAPYKSAARRISGPRSAKPAGAASSTAAVRSWAADNGIEVNPRGRLREDILRQYTAAQS